MLCVLLGLLGLVFGLLWWRLDRLVRSRLVRIETERAYRVIKIPPVLAGPHRSGGGGSVRIDETEEALAQLHKKRRLIRYLLGAPIALVVLGVVLITDGAALELLWEIEAWRRCDRDRVWRLR